MKRREDREDKWWGGQRIEEENNIKREGRRRVWNIKSRKSKKGIRRRRNRK